MFLREREYSWRTLFGLILSWKPRKKGNMSGLLKDSKRLTDGWIYTVTSFSYQFATNLQSLEGKIHNYILISSNLWFICRSIINKCKYNTNLSPSVRLIISRKLCVKRTKKSDNPSKNLSFPNICQSPFAIRLLSVCPPFFRLSFC